MSSASAAHRCAVCRFSRWLGFPQSSKPDLEWALDASQLDGRWCPACLIRDLDAGFVDPAFRRVFNRDPERKVPTEPGLVVAPADGILEIEERPDFWKLTIRIRLSDVHVQRVPLEGIVQSVDRLDRGEEPIEDARYPDGAQVITKLKTELGLCELRQITSRLTPRIRNFLKPGQRVERGERLGRILLGSTAIFSMPKRASPTMAAGAQVFAGETVLARYDV